MITFKIDGISVEAKKGETILQAARKSGVYIPTMCYISKTTPCASCRMCSVEVKGVDGFILSCNTPPTAGIEVVTNSQALLQERTNIMKLYDVNHPLECGVCDKSGECDLQNKTLEFGVNKQNFTARDQSRKIENWGLISYDPSLCILCEKCVHVCNEVIGDDAIEVKFGGYSSTIIPKNSDVLDCSFCGECIAVCPVGALVSSDFKYRANAWELNRIPATCAHCSGGCSLEYETRQGMQENRSSILRVKNNFEFASLCGAGRFGFDFDSGARRDDVAFEAAIKALKRASAIRFSSLITNEEAHILNLLKKKFDLKLFNEDARMYANFMRAYGSVSGKRVSSASLDALKMAEAIVVLGSMVATDNPAVRYAITTAAKRNGARVAYAHPIEDAIMQNVVTQFLKYEVGSEEGVIALMANAILSDADLSQEERAFFDNLDLGYIGAESNIGEEEIVKMLHAMRRASKRVLVVGQDVIAHPRAQNIAKIVALIEKYSDFSVLVIPKEVNTLGVSLIADLDVDVPQDYTFGYNAKGDFVVGSFGNPDLYVPALNQQEGSFTTIDMRVVPTNVATPFSGYTLNDIASACDIVKEHTAKYTQELGVYAGFKNVAFDALENFLSHDGSDERGYLLDEIECEMDGVLEAVADLPEYNGTVIYYANPILQFNAYTNMAKQLHKDATLRGSAQFAMAAKIADGDRLAIASESGVVHRVFKLESELKGTIALCPTFDVMYQQSGYRFEKSNITRVNHE